MECQWNGHFLRDSTGSTIYIRMNKNCSRHATLRTPARLHLLFGYEQYGHWNNDNGNFQIAGLQSVGADRLLFGYTHVNDNTLTPTAKTPGHLVC